ncbi:hypothetical protein A5gp_00046 [Alteromonas phage vB_AemP_PT15-A5]|nr:hypothetical protein A5gp_00046 [Alteromonas phage vB_AemP_PT15-A5]
MTLTTQKLIKSLNHSYELAGDINNNVLSVCEEVYKDALKEHTDLTAPQIHNKWLTYNATVFKDGE